MGEWTDRQTVHDIEALSSQITYYYTFLLSSLYTLKKGAVQWYKQNVVDKIAMVLEFVLNMTQKLVYMILSSHAVHLHN